MGKYIDGNVLISLFLVSAVFVNCIPTSVLINSKATSTVDNNKVKRASDTNPASDGSEKHVEHPDEKKSSPQKRGVNPQYHRDVPENNIYANGMSNGYWEDTDTGLVYPEIKELDDYQPIPLSYRPNSNAYDNLQNILNGNNGYEEPLALPISYPAYPRYFPDRKKRSFGGLRLKESKLSPAEMVALLELIEDRSRMDNSPYASNNLDFQNSPYELPAQEDNGEWWNSNTWNEPSVQYYGNPYNNNLDIDGRYGGQIERQPNYYPTKRFMVAKKKRSLSPHDSNFVMKNSPGGFDSRFTFGELNNGGAQKQHSKYF